MHQFNNITGIFASCLIALTICNFAVAQESIEGIWLNQEGNSKIEIYQDDAAYQGKVVWLARTTDKKGNPITDSKNPDKSLRDRPIMGMQMLKDIQMKDGKGHGEIYAPKRGLTLDCELELASPEQLNVNVSYRGFTRQQIWTRTSL